MLQVCDFVLALHGKGYLLLVPIEHCTLVDTINARPMFYYFDHLNSLILQLQDIDPSMKEETEKLYPIDEIKSNPQ
jgi:hypothetical protein